MAPKKGSLHHKAKLTEAQVLEMRDEYATSRTPYLDLAIRYGLDSVNTVHQIITRKTWTHI